MNNSHFISYLKRRLDRLRELAMAGFLISSWLKRCQTDAMLAPEFSLVLVSMLVQLTTIRAEKTQGAEHRMWRVMRRRLMRLSLASLGCDILSIH